MSDLVRVCQEWFPNEKYPERSGFWMDSKLKNQLDIAVKNITHDWDFTVIITAGGEVRVGKSVLGLQICCYWSYQMEKVHNIRVPFELKKNVVFNWEKLIQMGHELASETRYCALQYDEAGETMEGTKSASRELRAIKDYLRECGQYNFLNVLVMPEYFDLPKGIAMTRSMFLIDVYYSADQEGYFQRGYFRFYSKKKKKELYLKGKKELNYKAATYNFDGEFRDFYPLDKEEYKSMKIEALKNRGSNIKDAVMEARNAAWAILKRECGWTDQEIADKYHAYTGNHIHKLTVNKGVSRFMNEV